MTRDKFVDSLKAIREATPSPEVKDIASLLLIGELDFTANAPRLKLAPLLPDEYDRLLATFDVMVQRYAD